MTRRDYMQFISARSMRALLALLSIAALAPAQVARFRVRETAGLRRFSFPVRASLAGQGIQMPAPSSARLATAQ